MLIIQKEVINIKLTILLKDPIDNKIKFDIPIPKQTNINKYGCEFISQSKI